MYFESFHWLSHHGLCAIIPCFANVFYVQMHTSFIFFWRCDNVLSEYLPFQPFVFLLMYSNNRTSFDTRCQCLLHWQGYLVYIQILLILLFYYFYYNYYYVVSVCMVFFDIIFYFSLVFYILGAFLICILFVYNSKVYISVIQGFLLFTVISLVAAKM